MNRRLPLFAALLVALTTSACSAPPYVYARASTNAASYPAAVEHWDGYFYGRNNVILYEQLWRPRTPSRGIFVLVHGLKDHSTRYAAFAEDLVRQGFSVYAFDLRGHAHSAGMRVDISSFDDYLDDLDIFLTRIRKTEPNKPIFLFGHSMGGAIATLYTIRHQPDLAGLVLSGAALEAGVSSVTIFGTKLVAALSPHAGVFNLKLDDFSRDPEVVAECKRDPFVYQGGGTAETAKYLVNAIAEIDARMEAVRVPLLIMHGGADRVTPPDGSRELARRAKSTDKTLQIYDGLYHDLLHEPEHAQVDADVIAWARARAEAK